jgi:nitroreductase
VKQENSLGLFETVYTTRSLRRFRPDPIPEEVLFQIFDAAIRAPSGQNAQDWRFVVVTDPAIKQQMQSWAEEGWARYQPRYAKNPALMDQLPRTQRLALKGVAHLTHNLARAPGMPHRAAVSFRLSRTFFYPHGPWAWAVPSSIYRSPTPRS